MDELKPCPSCESTLTSTPIQRFQNIATWCRGCGMHGPVGETKEEAEAAWNALPREPEPPTLVWSSERPTVAGWYWVRFAVPQSRDPWIISVDADYVDHAKDDLIPSNLQFAGPIPEPMEAAG